MDLLNRSYATGKKMYRGRTLCSKWQQWATGRQKVNIKRKLHDFFCTIRWSQNYIWFWYPCSSSFRCCYKDTNNSNNSFMCLKGMTPDFFKEPTKSIAFCTIFLVSPFSFAMPKYVYLYSMSTKGDYLPTLIVRRGYFWTSMIIGNSNT